VAAPNTHAFRRAQVIIDFFELDIRSRIRRVSALRDISVEVESPKGTIYVWAPVPEGHSSASFSELVLEQAAVVVSPGSMYGPSGEGFFRISLTTPDERIAEAVERMREHLA
jgi:LL-diaminopimelate aminotransferase